MSSPYYGSSPDFCGIGGHLLREYPPITAPAIDPTAPGFGSHGPHLLAPFASGPDGSRSSACPVCFASAPVPPVAVGWAQLRCAACGTEFTATDGTAFPPPPTPPTPTVEVKSATQPETWIYSPVALLSPPPPPPSAFHLPRAHDKRYSDGRRYVLCPRCSRMINLVSDRPDLELILTCPGCRGQFVAVLSSVAKKRSLWRKILGWIGG